NFHTTGETFSIARCSTCGVAQTLPRPADSALGQYYPPAYYPIGGYDPSYYARTLRPAQQEKLAIVRQFRSSGRLLDVGCGAGFFVREASEAGFAAEGIEFSHDAVEFGRRQWGTRLAEGDILSASIPGRSFDVVTLWHVLEHIPRPVEALRKIKTLLTPEGILVIAVPNFDSIQAGLFRGRWYHLEVPRHLYHFSPSSLRRLLAGEGFTVEAESQRSPEHNWAGILGSLMPLVSPDGSLAGSIFRRVAARPASRALATLETAFRRGGTFTLVSALKA
ncbi:MAG TPA: class I SAM-dependent methyltransferase, partial [Bacteroidota bacterium]|nr:class I SAM-dependent methyltransferase [Bacteroidota bacterium]